MKKNKSSFFLFVVCLLLISFVKNESISTMLEVDHMTPGEENKIQGKMQINGVNYNAICDCSPVTPENTNDLNSLNAPKCDPSKLTIHGEKTGQGANYDDVRNLVGNIEELNYVFVPDSSFKCLDGRNRESVLAVPGGDAGEFILALLVYEDLVGGGRKLVQENVDNFLVQYLKTMKQKKFYMCTDDMAIAHLEKELSVK